MMKNKYICISLLCLLLSACLSENPIGKMPEDKAYTSAKDIEQNLVATLYNYIGGATESEGLQGTPRGVYDWNSITTDEQLIPIRGGDWYDGGFWLRLHTHTWTPTELPLENTWNYLYKVITLCNKSLYNIEKNKNVLSDAEYTEYTSEVRAIRALFYFYTMDMFGNIPLVTDYHTTQNQIKQSNRNVVYQFIVDELQSVLPYLANEHSNYKGKYYGRITRPVAEFLLAKLCLNAEVYSDDDWTDEKIPNGEKIYFTIDGEKKNAWEATIAYCEKIKKTGYVLDEYAKNFCIHNEESKENIFVIPMEKMLYSNTFSYLFRSRHYAHGSALGLDAENGTCATVSTVKAYGYGTDSVDPRFQLNFFADTVKVNGNIVKLSNGKPLVYYPLEVADNMTGSLYEKTGGARMSKYETDPMAYDNGHLQDNDIVLFRYADVLLMEAEAKTRNGMDGKEELAAVEKRVGATSLFANLDNILKERLLELMWEGWRRNDLIRFGKFDEDKHLMVFPIPSICRDLNHNLDQNPGY